MSQVLTSRTLRESGKVVTVVNRYDGLEIGYLLDSVVYKTTGNGGVVKAENDVFGMVKFFDDGGAAYMARARHVAG